MDKKEIQQRLKRAGYRLKRYKQSEEYEVLCTDGSILILFPADKNNFYEELIKELNHHIKGIQTFDDDYLIEGDNIKWLHLGYLPKLLEVREVLQQ